MYMVNDVIETKIHCTTPGENAINVLHYKVNAVVGPPVADSLWCNAFFVRIQVELTACMANEATFSQVTMQKVLPLPVGAPAFSTSLPIIGSEASDLLPRQVCGMITKRSVLAGRANRGRMYVPYPGEFESNPDGNPTPSYVAKLDTLANRLFVPITLVSGPSSIDILPVILNRLPGTTVGIVGWTPRSRWATQRRRNAF